MVGAELRVGARLHDALRSEPEECVAPQAVFAVVEPHGRLAPDAHADADRLDAARKAEEPQVGRAVGDNQFAPQSPAVVFARQVE